MKKMSEEIKISQLQEANEISDNDFMMIIQSGVNKKKNIKQMAKELNPVVVSPTQPTTNEKVWFKKGKNKFDKSRYIENIETGAERKLNLKLEPNTVYTMSSNMSKASNNTADLFFASGSNKAVSTDANGVWNGQSRTVTSDENGYVTVAYRKQSSSQKPNLIDAWYQIEQGSKASAYEAYIEPTMFVKNEGIFENFGAELLSNQFKLVDRNNSTNYNDFKASGFYQCNFQNGTNAPSAYATGMLLVFASYYIVQLLISHINNEMHVYTRISTDKGSTWLAWKEL